MGNTFSSIWNSLKTSIFSRREGDRLRPDHPEIVSPNDTNIQLAQVTNNHAEVVNNASKIKTSEDSMKCSEFYWACRNGNVQKVKQLLHKLEQSDIDQIEPNGSTALHAASYHGHGEIVQLLLEKSADRSIKNKFGYLPFDEAANNDIKEIFLRMPNVNRLRIDDGNITWEYVDDEALNLALEERRLIKFLYDTTSAERMFGQIEKYIKTGFTNYSKINEIIHFFEKAKQNQDPIWIIKAYTAETDFYNVLNSDIAAGASSYESQRRYIIALLVHHPKLDHLSFLGISYRVMTLTDDSFNKYKVGSLTKTKSFLSSTIDEKIAVGFLYREENENKTKSIKKRLDKNGKQIKSWIMCKYHVKHRRTALNIENVSQYVVEGEILIMPSTVFKVKSKQLYDISYIPRHEKIWMVEFEECGSYSNDQQKMT